MCSCRRSRATPSSCIRRRSCSRSSSAVALAGLLGAILALPVAAALRDVVRYLFRRLSPDAPDALATSIAGLGLERPSWCARRGPRS